MSIYEKYKTAIDKFKLFKSQVIMAKIGTNGPTCTLRKEWFQVAIGDAPLANNLFVNIIRIQDAVVAQGSIGGEQPIVPTVYYHGTPICLGDDGVWTIYWREATMRSSKSYVLPQQHSLSQTMAPIDTLAIVVPIGACPLTYIYRHYTGLLTPILMPSNYLDLHYLYNFYSLFGPTELANLMFDKIQELNQKNNKSFCIIL